MTNDELRFLYQQYAQACERVNPAMEEIPWALMAEHYEALKKSPNPRSLLIELSFSEIIELSLHLLRGSPEDSSSGGSVTPS
jgi:hypothetical protein